MQPIFIGITRSFWLTLAGLAAIFGAGEPVLAGLATLADPFLAATQPEITAWLTKIAPMILWLAAMRERAGAARPYTLDPRAVK